MKVISFGKTEKGKAHVENEDDILVDKKFNLYAVADGVTLPYGGREASTRVIKYLKSSFKGNLKNAFEILNKKLCQEKQTDPSIGTTTLTAAHIRDDKLQVAHIGDSPAYLVRGKSIRLITHPDSVPGTSMLTQVIGMKSIDIHSYEERLHDEDFVVLATDGITNVLSEEEIFSTIKENKKVEEIVEKMVLKARKKSKLYKDDRSVVVVSVLQ